jgi:hypothetical protein
MGRKYIVEEVDTEEATPSEKGIVGRMIDDVAETLGKIFSTDVPASPQGSEGQGQELHTSRWG